jgi:imidazolonepropionase-like amidohydrolase
MHQDHDLGSVEEGKLADVIAVRGDPLAHPEILDDLSRVALVIRGGTIVKDLIGT